MQNEAYHSYDVLEHSLRAVLYADGAVRLCALLHDIGKPRRYADSGNYHGHEKEGARIARQVCTRLKVPKKIAEEAETLTYLHMYDVDLQTSVNRIKKFIVDNLKNFDKLLMIKQADFSACKDDTSEAPCVTKWKKIYGDMKNGGAPFTLSQLKINGSDLIESGVPPEKIGAILKSFLYDCVIDTRLNDKKTLIRRAQKLKFD